MVQQPVFRLYAKRISHLYAIASAVLPKYKSVIFLHGCFWHRHPGCPYAYTPKSRTAFWEEKFSRTIAHDTKVQGELKAQGWRVLVVWECELKERKRLVDKLRDFLAGF